MKYQLLAVDSNGQVVVDIPKIKFDEVNTARNICLVGLDLEEKLALLLENYFEFEVSLLQMAEKSLIWGRRDHTESMAEILQMERRIVNLLTSCRLYLDQTDHNLSTIFGNPSAELTAIKTFKNGLYDNHWGYRLMETVRNHVQHVGFLVHDIKYLSSLREDKGMPYSEDKVIPSSNVSTLEAGKSIKPAILKELGDREDIDLRGPIREYVSCFSNLHGEIRRATENQVLGARTTYEKALTEFSQLNGAQIHPLRLESMNSSDNALIETVPLVTDFFASYDYLRKKNVIDVDFTQRSASNID